jgi:F-type H+-transporting ATPase subunit b
MDELLGTLGDLFIGALPSAIFLLFLFFYLRAVIFKPLDRILAERHAKTGGREEHANQTLKLAEQKLAEYSQSLHAAKAEIYGSQEALRKELEAARDQAIAEAAEKARQEVAAVKERLHLEMKEARNSVDAQAKGLADLITSKVLSGGVA